ncbi:MAG: GNAT family N-acetyltransferase [bacterium]|nr:GNAT family N-acetyltransferase [bacterium]
MVMIIRGKDRKEHQEYFDQLFKLRYKIFIEGRGWSLPTKQGLEIDQYDDEEAIYFLDLNEERKIEGTVRITPTEKSSLTADYFSHLIENGQSARAHTVYEATRYIVRPSKRSREENRAAKSRLLSALTEWCLKNGVESIQTVIDSNTLPTFIELNPKVRPMGLSYPYGGGRQNHGGGDCMAIRWPISQEILECVRIYGGLDPTKDLNNPDFVTSNNPSEMIQ